MKIKREIYVEWLKRLRSGDYPQGVSYLRREEEGKDRFCCWGILCEIAVESNIVTRIPASNFESDEDGNGIYAYQPVDSNDRSGADASTRAPLEVVGYWMGALEATTSETYETSFWKAVRDLSSLNDQGVSFLTIANNIESRLWELI